MEKEAQLLAHNPKYVAEEIKNIIGIMVGRMSPEAQMRSFPNIANKLKQLNIVELSNKKSPGGASIGVSISLVKNILNGRDPNFIKLVLDELTLGA
jgi:hypothetical protein